MRTKTESRTKRLADLQPGDEIVIDKGGHTAHVEINEPHSDPTLRARGYYETIFTMADRGPGGWTGHADSLITLATQTEIV